jgi:hypothetical protein
MGLIRRSQPWRPQLRPGRDAAVTLAMGRLPAPEAGSARLSRLVVLVRLDTDTCAPLPCKFGAAEPMVGDPPY